MKRVLTAIGILVLVGPTALAADMLGPQPPENARYAIEGKSGVVRWIPADAPRDGFRIYGESADSKISLLSKAGPNQTAALVPLGYVAYYVTSTMRETESATAEAVETTLSTVDKCVEITLTPPGVRFVKCRGIQSTNRPVSYYNPSSPYLAGPTSLIP